MYNVKAMKVFVEVAERGSFVAAAEHLGMSTSSVSRLVVDLEDWLGTALLRRTTRSLTLTDAGERYLERCLDIVRAWENLHRDARALTDRPFGKLHVAAAAHPLRRRIAPLLPEFLRRYPEVQLHLHLQDQPVDLVAEGIDIAIRIGALEDSSLIARKCGDIAIRLTAAPSLLAARGMPESREEIPSYPCLVDTTSRHGSLWPLGRRIRVAGPLVANDGEVVRQMTLAGLGISFLPDFFVDEDIAEGRLIELFPDEMRYSIGMYTLFPLRRHLTPAARVFADFVADKLSPRAPPLRTHENKG